MAGRVRCRGGGGTPRKGGLLAPVGAANAPQKRRLPLAVVLSENRLLCQTATGQVPQSERQQPPGFAFNAPTVRGDNISQDEINEAWESGGIDFTLAMSFREDIYELAKDLRPVSKAERYAIEMAYWKSEGDDRRADLLNELFQKAAAAEEAAGIQSDVHRSSGEAEA